MPIQTQGDHDSTRLTGFAAVWAWEISSMVATTGRMASVPGKLGPSWMTMKETAIRAIPARLISVESARDGCQRSNATMPSSDPPSSSQARVGSR